MSSTSILSNNQRNVKKNLLTVDFYSVLGWDLVTPFIVLNVNFGTDQLISKGMGMDGSVLESLISHQSTTICQVIRQLD